MPRCDEARGEEAAMERASNLTAQRWQAWMDEAYRAVETTILAASKVPMEARRNTMRNAVTCVVGLMLLVGCGDAPGTAASTGLSTNTPPATRQGPRTRKADLVGAITAVTPFEPVTEGCTPPKQLDPNAAASRHDPPA